jgi:hypothetical protein
MDLIFVSTVGEGSDGCRVLFVPFWIVNEVSDVVMWQSLSSMVEIHRMIMIMNGQRHQIKKDRSDKRHTVIYSIESKNIVATSNKKYNIKYEVFYNIITTYNV